MGGCYRLLLSRFMDTCAHFCVCVCVWCVWFHSLCLSVFPSCRAPDKVIRAVTVVARLHCLYLTGRLCGVVSDRCCSCPVLLYVSLSSWVCFCLLAFLDSWRVRTGRSDFSACAGYSTLPDFYCGCVLELSNKDYLFHSQLGLEFLFHDRMIWPLWIQRVHQI